MTPKTKQEIIILSLTHTGHPVHKKKAPGETGFDWIARAKLKVPCLEICSIE